MLFSEAKIHLYDLTGKCIKSLKVLPKQNLDKVELEMPDLAKGTYLIHVLYGDQSFAKKIWLQ